MTPRAGLTAWLLISVFFQAESKCHKGCDLALASYYIWAGSNLTFIAQMFNELSVIDSIVEYNKGTVKNKDYVDAGSRVNVPFPCDCIDDEFLGHPFQYQVKKGDTYEEIANTFYSSLTTPEMLQRTNIYAATDIPEGVSLSVIVNCSCGNPAISKDYGLFITYPLREEDSFENIAEKTNLNVTLLQEYNPDANFDIGSGLIFIPGKYKNGDYPSLLLSKGPSGKATSGISIAVVAVVFLVAVGFYFGYYRRKKIQGTNLLAVSNEPYPQKSHGLAPGSAHGVDSISRKKSVEFSYEELANATNNFSLTNKIGQGGFGAVYFAELRGERAAIKQMAMKSSKEFIAELKVLTRVHHINLVRLIGFCVENSLFLIYEFIENGSLSQHLLCYGKDPLPWGKRVQIALDSARGLEYIHEHTNPVYIHCDIKSDNILIDKNFRGKVADFGLAKLTEAGTPASCSRIKGTFGYMAPEYAGTASISPKVDVFAFGVVLYQLISAKKAVVMADSTESIDAKALVALFENALHHADPMESIRGLVDLRLGDNYPEDSVLKIAQLANQCTHRNPDLRPSMRFVAAALMEEACP